MNFLLILLFLSTVQLSEASPLDWLKDAWNWLKGLFGFGSGEEGTPSPRPFTRPLFSTTFSTNSTQTTTENTNSPEWFRTKPVPRWARRELDDFATQCFQLGVVDFRLKGSKISQSPFSGTKQRIKRYPIQTLPTTTPFTHPKKPPPPHYVCMQNFEKFTYGACHPPQNRESSLDCVESTTVNPPGSTPMSQVLWVMGESDPNLSHPQQWNYTAMLEACCASTFNQCQCFYRFGEAGTPSEGICAALLMQESGKTPSPTLTPTTPEQNSTKTTQTSSSSTTSDATKATGSETTSQFTMTPTTQTT